MNILLVNPVRNLSRAPNLPLGYLAAVLEKAGHQVRVADRSMRGLSEARLHAIALGQRWDVVGIQIYSFGYDEARHLARAVRARWPGTKILVGGRHVTALPEETLLEEPAFDAALVSEAEGSICAYVEALKEGPDALSRVPNLVYRGGPGGELHRGPALPYPPLDDLPQPAWSHIAPNLYPTAPQGGVARRAPIAPMITSRGCPYRCRFCASGLQGHTIRFRDPARVVDEMAMLVERFGVREVQILDDNFTLRRAHAEAILAGVLARGLDLALSLPNGVRLDRLDPELIQLFERAGGYSMTVGIDSGSQRVLDAMDRAVSLEEMEARIHMVKAHSRLRLTGNFILGLPGETREDLAATLRFAMELPLDRAYFAMYLPLPGSALFEELRGEGKLAGLEYHDLSEKARRVAYSPDGIPPEELRRWLIRAYAGFYLRPRVLHGLVGEVRSAEHLRALFGRVLGRLRGVED
jgi:radical SAM superfamily enzyme YgiQ (UPF0313 family)